MCCISPVDLRERVDYHTAAYLSPSTAHFTNETVASDNLTVSLQRQVHAHIDRWVIVQIHVASL
jgi:hypothetical protein